VGAQAPGKSLRSVGVGGRISLIGVLAGTGDVNHTQILIKALMCRHLRGESGNV